LTILTNIFEEFFQMVWFDVVRTPFTFLSKIGPSSTTLPWLAATRAFVFTKTYCVLSQIAKRHCRSHYVETMQENDSKTSLFYSSKIPKEKRIEKKHKDLSFSLDAYSQ